MSIKELEEIAKDFLSNIGEQWYFTGRDAGDIKVFMINVISLFKDQSDQIADLRKYIAETLIDYDNIKIGGND